MSIPQDPEIQTPGDPTRDPMPGSQELPDDNPPIDTPMEPTDPEIRAPGSEEMPMDAPREEMGSD
jgi:hypothetical protein